MNKNQTSKKLSFLQLLSIEGIQCCNCCNYEIQPLNKIEIPIIQRDYAQGREDKNEIRINFLNALLGAINDKELELDFIYGSIKDNTFQPLDGQQRLTTLFLLHWYIATKENKLNEELKKILNKFTYETRTSSREFCNELINVGIVYNKLSETDYYDKEENNPKNNQLSKTIIDSSWFFLSWKNDPTIKSMLNALDSIHLIFQNTNQIWENLNKITFHFIELQNFGLTDDLYIKMNARGKALTNFENFKAKFEKYIKKENWEANADIKESFSNRIDNLWMDLFWNNVSDKSNIDSCILKFMVNIAIVAYAQNKEIYYDINEIENIRKELELKSKSGNISDDQIKNERIARRIVELVNDSSLLKYQDFYNQDSFNNLKKWFDIYALNNNNANQIITINLWDFEKQDNNYIFKDFIKIDKPSYKQRVLLYAQTQFLFKNDTVSENSFKNWMRVVRNIVYNSTIDSAQTLIGAINLIEELSNGSDNIYNFLSLENSFESNFAKSQVEEERRKAKLIYNDPEITSIIFELEDTSFCKGTINWCLECSGEIDKLENIKEIIDTQLNKKDISNTFRRALLTIGNNDFYNYWGSWSYSTNTHKRCLIENTNELKKLTTDNNWFNNYLKPLIEELCINGNNLYSIIEDFKAKDNLPIWKKRLINEVELLDKHCIGHYFGFTDDNSKCYLFHNKKRPSSIDECFEVV